MILNGRDRPAGISAETAPHNRPKRQKTSINPFTSVPPPTSSYPTPLLVARPGNGQTLPRPVVQVYPIPPNYDKLFDSPTH